LAQNNIGKKGEEVEHPFIALTSNIRNKWAYVSSSNNPSPLRKKGALVYHLMTTDPKGAPLWPSFKRIGK
jgi:hypothetical protein